MWVTGEPRARGREQGGRLRKKIRGSTGARIRRNAGYTLLYSTLLCSSILYYAILYYSILYYTGGSCKETGDSTSPAALHSTQKSLKSRRHHDECASMSFGI